MRSLSSFPILIAARALQGFGAAGIMSVNPALVRFIYPSHLLGRLRQKCVGCRHLIGRWSNGCRGYSLDCVLAMAFPRLPTKSASCSDAMSAMHSDFKPAMIPI